MGRQLLVSLAILLLAAVLVSLLLVVRQEHLVFFPDRTRHLEPSQFGLTAEALSLPAGGLALEGWWIHGSGKTALAYFPGNAGNVGDRLERARLLVERLNLDVFLVDYPGYGRSSGSPTETGLYAHGAAVSEAAAARGFRPERTVFFGESLGCAVAIETALRKPCAGLILEAPFLSIAAMARRYYPWIPRSLVRLSFDNGAKIGRLPIPKLIAQAERDEIIPPEQTRRLFELASPPKTYFVIPGASHNDTYLAGGSAYLEAWRRFLAETVPAR